MLVDLPDGELARRDVAAVNLACAQGLPGTAGVDWDLCLAVLDDWGRRCAGFTARVLPAYHRGVCDYPDSEPRFRVQAMITHLQRDIGVSYRRDRVADDAVFEPADSFVHGVTLGGAGTCGNLPVCYVAVGRRLGYPLMLVDTRSHLFCRWDALPFGECFNIEASGEGVSFFPDDHYRTGRFEMPAETVAACGYLESLSPRGELAMFMGQRGAVWQQERNWREAATAFAWANQLDPRRGQYALLTHQAVRMWDESVRGRLPSPRFPALDLGVSKYQFGELARDVERQMIGLGAVEALLADAELERRWWAPLRSDPGGVPAGLPRMIKVDVAKVL